MTLPCRRARRAMRPRDVRPVVAGDTDRRSPRRVDAQLGRVERQVVDVGEGAHPEAVVEPLLEHAERGDGGTVGRSCGDGLGGHPGGQPEVPGDGAGGHRGDGAERQVHAVVPDGSRGAVHEALGVAGDHADPRGAVLEEPAEGLGLPFAVVLDPPDLSPHAGDRGEVVVAVVADLGIHAPHPRRVTRRRAGTLRRDG